ncbi:hypothetical protein JCM11491_000474 [Sporobolomyces phaffii]
MMDLDALRKAALSSKKRKLATQAAAEPTSQLSPEKEEGEIDDDATLTAPAPVHASAAFLAIKAECKQIISELLSYGIPPDYMLSIGVSRDVLRTTFHELHLDASLIPPTPNLSAQSSPFEPSHLSTVSTPRPFPTDYNTSSKPYNTQEESNIDYEALEQEKRKKLFAKKAALKARNQRQAQSLESELESLFAVEQPPDAVKRTGGEDLQPRPGSDSQLFDGPLAKRPRLSRIPQVHTAEEVHSLREAIDHVDETVQLPPAGPFAYNPSFARPTHSLQRRPVAADLDQLPSHPLSESALSRQRIIGGFGGALFAGRSSAEDTLVIEISDDENEEDEGEDAEMANGDLGGAHDRPVEGRQGGSATAEHDGPSPGGSHGPVSSTLPVPINTADPKATQVAEILRQRQIEEKELQIKRIMERIKDMESRQKRASSALSEAEPTTTESPAPVQQEINNSEVDKRLPPLCVDIVTVPSARRSPFLVTFDSPSFYPLLCLKHDNLFDFELEC